MAEWLPISSLMGPAQPPVPVAPRPPSDTPALPVEAVERPSSPNPSAAAFSLPQASSSPAQGRAVISKFAVACVALVILAMFVKHVVPVIPAALAAVICGHKALRRIQEPGHGLCGKWLARLGLVVGYLELCWTVSITVMVLAMPNAVNVRAEANKSMNNRNLKFIVAELDNYALHHGMRFPDKLEEAPEAAKLMNQFSLLFVPQPGWTSEKAFGYVVAGKKVTPDMQTPVFISLSKGPAGERVVAHQDGSVTYDVPNLGR